MTEQSTTERTNLKSSSMIEVGSYPTRSDDAELAQMSLWAAGIQYVIAADAGAPYAVEPNRRMQLLVEERDADDARFVLTALA